MNVAHHLDIHDKAVI